MTKLEKAYEKAQKAHEMAEEYLRDCELQVAGQAEVAAGHEKVLHEAIREGRSPGKGIHEKRRQHRDAVADLRLVADAARTVVAERQEEMRVAFVAMERERQGLVHERAAELASLMRNRLEEVREMAAELATVSETHRRSRHQALSRGDPGPNSPDPIGKHIPPGAWSKLEEVLRAFA